MKVMNICLQLKTSAVIDEILPLYKSDSQTSIYTKTFTEINEASHKLAEAAENTKKVRIEKESAAKKREEERLARKAAIEEKQRIAAEKAANRSSIGGYFDD